MLDRMEASSTTFWASIILGILAGLMTVAMAGRWLRAVAALRSDPGRSVGGVSRTLRRVMGVPVIAFLHPLPWLFFVALPYAAYHFIWVRGSPDATRFFSILAGIVILWLVTSVVAIWYFRRLVRTRTKP
jgi:hypothetical protein